MSFIERKNEFKFEFKTRKNLQKFVNEVKEMFPKVVIRTSSFKEGNECQIKKDIDSISVIKEIDNIAEKYE